MKYQLSLHGKEVTMILTPQQKLERAHVRLLDSNDLRFFGSIAMFGKTEISERLPTAGTNGIDTHKAYKHAITWKHLSDEDPLLANMAMDYVINLELYDMDKHQRLIKMPKGGLIDEKFRGMDTQQVYDILKKENEEGKHTPNININQGEGCEENEDDSQNAGDSGTEYTDDTETELSGKAGISYAATDSLGIYGELSGATNGEDSDGDTIRDFGGKVGVKFTF